MAYNNGFPMNYQQMYYPQFQQQMPQPQMMPQQVPQNIPTQQTQYPIVSGGFVRVRSENEARMYPVAPGNSVTFIDETGPFCYTKTVNMGQLDRPIFERYRLVKEDDAVEAAEAPQKPVETQVTDLSQYALAEDLSAFRAEIEAIKNDIDSFRSDLYGIAGKKKISTKKEAANDE